jgi:hypothetical protein
MSDDASPCRLYVYLARDAPVGVILRRGPSAWVRMSLWHTDTDEIEHGQWFAGRVYERRCDLSPDGRLFTYFARKESARTMAEVGADSWIAVSRPPWFTALALWTIGSTWCAGTHFHDERTLFAAHITTPPDRGTLPPWLALTKDPLHLDRSPEWTDRTVHFSRLLRDGWTPVPGLETTNPCWERHSPDGQRTLIMTPRADASVTDYGGTHIDEYALRDERDGSTLEIAPATWAGWDQRGRLVVARNGALHEIDESGARRLIASFNDQAPDPQPAPPEAARWPSAPR